LTTKASLLSEIRTMLGSAVIPDLTSASAVSDIFEAYILSILLQAAEKEGATISYEDVSGNVPTTFVFRTSPAHIYSTTHPYTHAVIRFKREEGVAPLEAHIGVRVAGKSNVLHECDIAVIDRLEAINCRRSSVSPRYTKLLLAVECKYYSGNLGIDLARSFLGLNTDLPTKDSYFVTNTSSDTVGQLIAHHNQSRRIQWEPNIVPISTKDVERLRGVFQGTFMHYKARSINRK